MRNLAFDFRFKRVRITDIEILRSAVPFDLPVGRHGYFVEIRHVVVRRIVVFGDIRDFFRILEFPFAVKRYYFFVAFVVVRKTRAVALFGIHVINVYIVEQLFFHGLSPVSYMSVFYLLRITMRPQFGHSTKSPSSFSFPMQSLGRFIPQ